MKLFESPDFYDAIVAATAHFQGSGLTEQLIEKDYYVTEALRVIATLYPTQVVFKGGTSLSKGWKLIDYLRYATRTIFRRPRLVSRPKCFRFPFEFQPDR